MESGVLICMVPVEIILQPAAMKQMLYILAVADAGFIEGGFCGSIAREKFGATPTFAENHAHFDCF